MRISLIFVFFLLLVIGMIAYGPCLTGGYIWDDHLLAEQHAVSTGQAPWTRAFSQEMYAGTRTNYYRPLVLLSYRLQGARDAFRPLKLHVMNVVLHVTVGFLLFCFLRRLTQDDFVGLFTSALFVLHPIHTEAVAYISGRADILVALFVMGSLLCLVAPERYGERPLLLLGLRGSALLLFAAALLSKESAVVFPVLLGVLRKSFRQNVRPFALGPFVFLGLVYFLGRQSWFNFSGLSFVLDKKSIALEAAGPLLRIAMFLKSLALYAGDLVFPFRLHMARSLVDESVGNLAIVGSGILVWALIVAWRRVRRDVFGRGLFFLGVSWFFVWLLPQSALVFPYIRADHFLYLAAAGLFWLIGMALSHRSYRRWVLCGLALYFGMSTFVHAGLWQDEHRFFERLHRLVPRNADVAENLATSHLRRGDSEDALLVYLQMIDPDLCGVPSDFCAWCARTLPATQPALKKAEHAAAASFFNAGVLLEGQGRLDDALCAYQSARRCDQKMGRAYSHMGLLLWRQGDREGAVRALKDAVAVEPGLALGWNNLAAFWASQGRMEEARSCLAEVFRLDPENGQALLNLKAWESPKNG
jgi:tetratricopeptide (TPR) repeat protein